jgi:hypothetical protein
MIARVALLVASLLATGPAVAQSMSPEAARQFVTGKQFVFTCVEGSRGLGRIQDDGSVIGAIQMSGSGPVHSITLPPGTLKVKGDAYAPPSEACRLSPALISAEPASRLFGDRCRA